MAPLPLGERHALIQTEQRVVRLHLHLVEQVRRRLVFDHDRDVAHLAREARGMVSIASATSALKCFARHRPPGRASAARAEARPSGYCFERSGRFRSGPALRGRACATGLDQRARPTGRSRSPFARCSDRTAASGGRSGGRAGSAGPRPCVQRSGGRARTSVCSTLPGSSLWTRPRRLATRSTCRSTGRPGTPSAWPSTTFAVLRPTPGSFISASMSAGTSPP